MPILSYRDADSLGSVISVDTASVVVSVSNLLLLRQLQVNRLVALQSSRPGQHLVGIVQRITRRPVEATDDQSDRPSDAGESYASELNEVRITLIGTMVDQEGVRTSVFRRTLESVPEIAANCFPIEGERLTNFMRAITDISADETTNRLSLGNYALDDTAEALLDGNRLFQRHAVIVGSTGSGKSWTTAQLAEQIAPLANANAILFDIHGEYHTLQHEGVSHLRIAGPADLSSTKSLSNGVLYLPHWLLGYEDMLAMILDRSDQNAPNQAMVFSREVVRQKRITLEQGEHHDILANFTIDSPIPYSLDEVISQIQELDREMVPGSSGKPKQGEFYGKLSRFISRLENRATDRRLGFLFQCPVSTSDFNWLSELATGLLAGSADRSPGGGGVKVVNFSEVPSDVLPIVVSLVARVVFMLQQWIPKTRQHPVALLCDEAHLYIARNYEGGSVSEVALRTFERIAKEGRKYGIGLVVISQRPSEVNRTVLSQCNNFIAMRLTNAEDQSVVRNLLPESLGSFSDLLPILDTGEAIVVGDASLLPSRIRIREPQYKPDSATVAFWERWQSDEKVAMLDKAVHAWRKQSLD